MTDYRIPYYKWQEKLETNQKWGANEVEAMFIELMEQCSQRASSDEKIVRLEREVSKRIQVIDGLRTTEEQLMKKIAELEMREDAAESTMHDYLRDRITELEEKLRIVRSVAKNKANQSANIAAVIGIIDDIFCDGDPSHEWQMPEDEVQK